MLQEIDSKVLIDLKLASKFGTISEIDCIKAIDEFLNQTIPSGFKEVSKAMFTKDIQVKLDAVTKHI